MDNQQPRDIPPDLTGKPNLGEIAARLGVDRSTVTRWITRGARPARRCGPGAKSIRLGATRLPAGWGVTDRDLAAFQEQLTQAWLVPTVADTLQTTTERNKQVDSTRANLIRLGLY